LETTVSGPYGNLTEGQFEITVTNPYPQGFYIKFRPYYNGVVHVKDDADHEYWSQSDTVIESGDTYNFGEILINEDHKGAWRAYSTIVNDSYDRGAWDFLVNEGFGFTPPALVSVYYPGQQCDCACYDPDLQNPEIHLQDDNDTKSLDTIQHEYGHYIMHARYAY
jgi:hypothetical protein